MALTVQTNTKKYCSYLYNNIDFSNKWFNFLMFYIYLFMFYFAILYFLTISVRTSCFSSTEVNKIKICTLYV